MRKHEISEKAAKRFKRFYNRNYECSHLTGNTSVMLHYCEQVSTYRTADPLMENTVVLATFEISPLVRARLEERNKAMRGSLPPLSKGVLVLYKPFEKPSPSEEDFADAVLAAYLFGGKCRSTGAKITK